jgi:hypothetical protein
LRFAIRFAIIFVSTLILYFISSQFRAIVSPTPVNNYVVLADAWLHGHLWVATAPLAMVDCVMYIGKCYVIEGPMPAVLMLPFVLVSGLSANQSLVCVLTAAAGVAAFDLLLGRMNIEDRLRLPLVAFFGFGTVFWWCAVNPNVWMFAHVACVTFLIFGLAEWYGKRRLWLVGLLFACAALTRFPAILAVLPFLYWAWTEGRAKGVRSFLIGFAPLMLLDVAYNLARWHTPFDLGYTLWYHQDTAGSPVGPPLALRYLPYNLYSYLFLGPGFTNVAPWIALNYQGVALTLTSPALLLALSAPRSRETLVLWSSAALVAIPGLLYYVNGYSQFGMRHSLDFTPFLLCLVARGFSRRPDALGYWLIAYSVAANAFGVSVFRV